MRKCSRPPHGSPGGLASSRTSGSPHKICAREWHFAFAALGSPAHIARQRNGGATPPTRRIVSSSREQP